MRKSGVAVWLIVFGRSARKVSNWKLILNFVRLKSFKRSKCGGLERLNVLKVLNVL